MMRQNFSLYSIAAAALMLTPMQSHAMTATGDSRVDVAVQHFSSRDRFPSEHSAGKWFCEIQVDWKWAQPLTDPILLEGEGDFRNADWNDGGPDYNSAQGSTKSINTATLIYKKKSGTGEDTGGPRSEYTFFVSIAQYGPFTAGQAFNFSPDAQRPGLANSDIQIVLDADDISGEADGYGTAWSQNCAG